MASANDTQKATVPVLIGVIGIMWSLLGWLAIEKLQSIDDRLRILEENASKAIEVRIRVDNLERRVNEIEHKGTSFSPMKHENIFYIDECLSA